MIEIVLAVAAPLGVLLIISRFCDEPFRRATVRCFVPLTLVWFSPFWLTGKTPAPLQYLFANIVPWKTAGVVTRNALLSDAAMQFLPWREIVATAWRHGSLPLLDRFAGSGSLLWANPQACVLAPTTLLGLPFSTFAWPLFAAVLKILIASTGTFAYLRFHGRSEAAATFGGVAYGFGAFTFAYMLFPLTNVTTLLPWLLLAIDWTVEREWRGVVFAACVTALLLTGGHPESVLHVAVLAIPYAIWRAAGRLRALALLSLAATSGFLLASPVVLPALRMLPLTERASRDAAFFRTPALSSENLLPFLFPAHFAYTPLRVAGANFNEVSTQYAGFAAAVLFVFVLVKEARRQKFWIVMFAVTILLAFDLVPLPLPVLHGRIRFVTAFIIAVLASRGIDLIEERSRALRMIGVGAMTIVVVAIVIFWPRYVRLGFLPIAIASAAAAAITATLLIAAPRRPLLVAVLCADLAILGMSSYSPASREMFYPPTPALRFLEAQPRPFRIAGTGGSLFPNSGTIFRLEDIRVHDPMAFEPYAAMLERGGLDRRGYFELFPGLPSRSLANTLGVRYIIAPAGMTSPLPAVYRGSDATIFLNAEALPRFSVEGPATLRLVHYDDASSRIVVTASGEATVVSSEVALPGWRLDRNGARWPLQSSGVLLTWRAPDGESDFRLSYEPPLFRLALLLSALGAAILLVAILRAARDRESSTHDDHRA
jgi:hypothetical protein